MLIDRLGLVKLPLALEVQRQVVQVAHHCITHRHTAKPVEGRVKLLLPLQGQTHHAVGLCGLFVGLQLARLGHQEALGRERQMAYDQQHSGKHQIHPGSARRQHAELSTQQQHEQHQSDDRSSTGGQSRKQRNHVARHEQKHRHRRPNRPTGLHDEMLTEDAGGDMGDGLCRRQRRVTRCRKGVAHAGCRGTDHDNLVGVLARGNLAGEHIVERVNCKRRAPIAPFVELRQHHGCLIRLDAQLANLHRFARIELDIAGGQIQAL